MTLDQERRLRAIEDRLSVRQSETAGGAGTAFPTGISAGFTFFRTDLGFLCYYDGTRWLSPEYSAPLYERATLAASTPHDWKVRADYAFYVTYISLTTSVAATNNGSNYWSVFVQGANTAFTTTTTIRQVDTSADTAGVNTDHSGAASTPAPSNNGYFRFVATVGAGAPGALTAACTVYYRLIIT